MLEELRISQLGVIDSSTLELGPGLTVITGETGAGKTMVVTALGLLLGGRADSGAVRSGAKQARVEGVVSTRASSTTIDAFRGAVEESGGEVEDDQVVLARNVAAQGRSRAWVGGATVPVTTLADVAEPLVAVHGQSDQHRLLRAGAQRAALDRFGGEELSATAGAYADLWAELARTERTLAEVLGSVRERAREADQLAFGLGEVEAVDPRPGEDVELAAEETRLGFADTLRVAAEQAREALSSEEGAPDALGTTAAARHALESVREHDATAGELADRLAELSHLLVDLAGDVASYATSLDTDPTRLAAVSERRAALTGLTRKYGETIDDVLSWAEEGAKRLLDLQGTDDQVAELEARRDRLRDELGTLAARLSDQRSTAAARLGTAVSDELTSLAMPHAVVSVEVRQQEVPAPETPAGPVLHVGDRWLRATQHGVDDVELLLAANTGADPRPLHKGASGGELSRVMLALEVSLAGTGSVPTFVFDEVDAGVGGRAAIEVGRRLAALARSSQVLVVTHLPQVAAYADRHVVVHKSSDGSVTTSGLVTLDDAERERELSRMLAGVEDSDSARAHARELLETAAPERACLPEGQGRG
ncbi:DNA repair protein RecN [Nocardioides zeicaulis]|uniref:DNA repair protein RecN n=1 Tax=Nocardioides zeicaulis TaxID=1776857 RepID=A0ABV6E797_9ACTN